MIPDSTPLVRHTEKLRAAIRRRSPQDIAPVIGARLRAGADGVISLHLTYWERPLFITWPDLQVHDAASGAVLDPLTQAMLAYYLQQSDGALPAGRWIAFGDLPDGAFYQQAHLGYTGRVLQQRFGDDVQAFAAAARAAGGQESDFADVSFVFSALPRVKLLAACWLGDEDFPSSYQILFDAHIAHHIPTEGCAILGSLLTQRILRHAGAK